MSDVPVYSNSTVELLDVIGRITREEASGWAVFDEQYRQFVVAAARKAGMSEHDAEDLYQELVIRLKAKLKTYEPRPTGAGGFRPWLAGVIRNMAYDFFRRRDNRGRPGLLPDEPETAESFSSVVAAGLDRELLARALDRIITADFPTAAWYGPAWRLFWLDDQPAKAIAARLGVGYEAVVKAISRMKKHLSTHPEVAHLLRLSAEARK